MAFSTGMRLATRAIVAQVIPPANYTGAASTDVYVSLKDTTHATIVISTGAWAGGTAAVTLLQATAVAGTSSKALAFSTVYTNATAPTSSVLTSTAVTSDTFNLSVAASTYVIEVDAASLDVANGFDCLCVHVATPGSNNDYYAANMILGQLRYAGKTPPNAMVD